MWAPVMECWTHNTTLFLVQAQDKQSANEEGKEVLTNGASCECMNMSNPSRNSEDTGSRSICRAASKRKLMHETFYSIALILSGV